MIISSINRLNSRGKCTITPGVCVTKTYFDQVISAVNSVGSVCHSEWDLMIQHLVGLSEDQELFVKGKLAIFRPGL